jgi:flagellar basal body P-ring formation protein FlgA
VVQKNDLVTMTVASTHMTLVMTGVAQEDGALGDTVRLLNPKSKKTVQGVVSGLKEVRIPSGSPLQLARN